VDDIGWRLEILYHSMRQLTETASAAVAGFLRPVAGGIAAAMHAKIVYFSEVHLGQVVGCAIVLALGSIR
jgi:hypothetical protein